MPELVLFAPSEKVLIDQNQNLSLISMLQSIGVDVPAGAAPPLDAGIPLHWDILTLWLRTPEDVGKQYEQRIEYILPGGHIGFTDELTFAMIEASQRNINNVDGLPIARAGTARLRLSLREAAGDQPWEVKAEYPIHIGHNILPAEAVTVEVGPETERQPPPKQQPRPPRPRITTPPRSQRKKR